MAPVLNYIGDIQLFLPPLLSRFHTVNSSRGFSHLGLPSGLAELSLDFCCAKTPVGDSSANLNYLINEN